MTNNYSTSGFATTLPSGAAASGAVTVAAMPGTWPSTPFTLLLDWGLTTQEAVSVTGVSGTGPFVLACTRGFDGTTAQSHATGAEAVPGVTAADFAGPAALVSSVAGVASGQLVGGTGTGTVTQVSLPLSPSALPTATTSAKGAVQLDGTASDIQPLAGSAAAGSTGKAADAGHVHPNTGMVVSVTAADTSVTVGGTSAAPTVATGTLDVIAAQHPPAANWSNNSHKITSVANGSAAQDAVAFGQLPSSSSPLPANQGGTGNTAGTAVNISATLDQVPAPAASVSLNSQKITNLANGSASTDAAAFGQIPVIDTTAADIKAPGTQAAGSTGKTADAGHVHPGSTVTYTSSQAGISVPAGATLLRVIAVGAGGGGGGSAGSSPTQIGASGGGGGAGQYVESFVPVSSANTYAVTVGAAGTAGTAGTINQGASGQSGGAGGDSIFNYNSSATVITAKGGTAGSGGATGGSNGANGGSMGGGGFLTTTVSALPGTGTQGGGSNANSNRALGQGGFGGGGGAGGGGANAGTANGSGGGAGLAAGAGLGGASGVGGGGGTQAGGTAAANSGAGGGGAGGTATVATTGAAGAAGGAGGSGLVIVQVAG